MSLLRQLERVPSDVTGIDDPGQSKSGINDPGYNQNCVVELQDKARALLREHGATLIANDVRIEWNPRLRTCAGRADYRHKRITLNPELARHPGEIDRTLRHELAHFLAQFREKSRRQIRPHGPEWRKACQELGIADEKRCHSLPFAATNSKKRFLYRCPKCWRDFPRVRRLRRAIACLACCRVHSRGKFDARFQLRLSMVDRPAVRQA